MIGRKATLSFRRHTIKASGPKAKEGYMGKTGITRRGFWKAFGKGMFGIGTHGKTEFGSTGQLRVNSTAKAMRRGHKLLLGRTTGAVVEKKYLDINQYYDMEKLESYAKQHGDDGTLRNWLDGKVPKDIIKISAEDYAKRALREEFYRIQTGRMRNISNTINSWATEAIFETLTGAKFDTTIPRTKPISPDAPKGIRYTEPIKIDFNKRGQAILNYRGQKFDVTGKLREIIYKPMIDPQ